MRKALGVRTVFNQLGPLVNPLRPNAQVLGVASEDHLEPMATALCRMGLDRAIIVHGSGGLDEASLEGDNKIVFVNKGKLINSQINIKDFKLQNLHNNELVVSKIPNGQILESVLNGSGKMLICLLYFKYSISFMGC